MHIFLRPTLFQTDGSHQLVDQMRSNFKIKKDKCSHLRPLLLVYCDDVDFSFAQTDCLYFHFYVDHNQYIDKKLVYYCTFVIEFFDYYSNLVIYMLDRIGLKGQPIATPLLQCIETSDKQAPKLRAVEKYHSQSYNMM